ncbi:hypothetical protein SAMN05192583_2206 [Sphingomonas gellani]|uniref:Uncharacterized protein n=1 Tax=Sphingomonas gellani TaxID=1166340 RepID=A0A1H8EL98_9SPHN|nr:hypothetical protein SAMN05192583_2206 [Sphingomonas gellani]
MHRSSTPEFPGFDPDHLRLPLYVFGQRRKLLKYTC